jgi:hypothetical protein
MLTRDDYMMHVNTLYEEFVHQIRLVARERDLEPNWGNICFKIIDEEFYEEWFFPRVLTLMPHLTEQDRMQVWDMMFEWLNSKN